MSSCILSILSEQLHSLTLSPDTKKHLDEKGLMYVGDIVQKNCSQLLLFGVLDKHTLLEVENALSKLDTGLSLGMHIPNWSRPSK